MLKYKILNVSITGNKLGIKYQRNNDTFVMYTEAKPQPELTNQIHVITADVTRMLEEEVGITFDPTVNAGIKLDTISIMHKECSMDDNESMAVKFSGEIINAVRNLPYEFTTPRLLETETTPNTPKSLLMPIDMVNNVYYFLKEICAFIDGERAQRTLFKETEENEEE